MKHIPHSSTLLGLFPASLTRLSQSVLFLQLWPDPPPQNSPPEPTAERPSRKPPPKGIGALDMIINSALVGGITFLSTLAAGSANWKAALIGGGLAFLAQLGRYRGISGR